MRVVSKTPSPASRWMDIRERILVEVLINGTMEQAAIQQQFEGCDIREDVQWLVDAALAGAQRLVRHTCVGARQTARAGPLTQSRRATAGTISDWIRCCQK